MIHLKRVALGLAAIAIGLAAGCMVTLAYYSNPITIAILLVFVFAYGIGSLWVEDK